MSSVPRRTQAAFRHNPLTLCLEPGCRLACLARGVLERLVCRGHLVAGSFVSLGGGPFVALCISQALPCIPFALACELECPLRLGNAVLPLPGVVASRRSRRLGGRSLP